jgi:hypothetical protein
VTAGAGARAQADSSGTYSSVMLQCVPAQRLASDRQAAAAEQMLMCVKEALLFTSVHSTLPAIVTLLQLYTLLHVQKEGASKGL